MSRPTLSEAIVVWSGWGRTAAPARDEARVVAELGADVALDLLPQIRALEDNFYESDARWVLAGLQEMGDRAADEFRVRHPEISDEAVEALAWCYTFDYK